MIVTRILGGLGNQMFQFAMARALSLKLNKSLRLDISGFESYELHQGFELNRVFNCSAEIAKKRDVQRVLGWQSLSMIRRQLSRSSMSALRSKTFVVEPHFNYWLGIKGVTEDCYLQGYWQSEKYFIDAVSQIRDDFIFKQAMNQKNSALANQICQVNAVSLHVRRGDYVNNSKTSATHGLCSLDYYQEAIQNISEQVEDAYFFVFSDDPVWVKSHLKIDSPHEYVDYNQGEESYNDMRLMSMCQHHIIANSSFSWWAAWLNPSPEKIVVAPRCWFADEAFNVRDLLPEKWIKL